MSEINTEKIIREFKPELKDNSVKQYVMNLKTLSSIFKSDNYKYLDDPQNVIEKLNTTINPKTSELYNFLTKRNILNAVIVFLQATISSQPPLTRVLKWPALDDYIEERDKYNKEYKEEQKKGTKSDHQKENWVDLEELYKMLNTMNDEIKPIKKANMEWKDMSKAQRNLIQAYTIFSIYVRIPMRNDVAGMEAISKREYNKLTEKDKEDNNYLVVERTDLWFVLNEYKTVKKYKEKTILIEDPLLKRTLRYYLKQKGMGQLFTTAVEGNPLTRNALTKLLVRTSEKYLNKKIGTTMLRHIYLTDKYGDTKTEQKKDAHNMGHSVNTQKDIYIKENG